MTARISLTQGKRAVIDRAYRARDYLLENLGSLEIAGLYDGHAVGIDMFLKGSIDLIQRDRSDLLFQVFIPGERPIDLRVLCDEIQQRNVGRTCNNTRIQISLLGLGEFGGGETVLINLLQLIHETELDLRTESRIQTHRSGERGRIALHRNGDPRVCPVTETFAVSNTIRDMGRDRFTEHVAGQNDSRVIWIVL